MNKKRPTSDSRVTQLLVMKVEHSKHTHMALVKKKKIRANNVKKKNMLIALSNRLPVYSVYSLFLSQN